MPSVMDKDPEFSTMPHAPKCKLHALEMVEWDRGCAAAKYVSPKYSIRMKTEFGAQIRKKMCESPDTSGPIDIRCMKPREPHYTCRKRTCKLLQLPGMTMDAVPGPGAYTVPSTTYFDHPAIVMPRRTTMSGPDRWERWIKPSMVAKVRDTPGPSTYDTKDFYKILPGTPNKFTIRIKPKMGGNINAKWTDEISGPLDHDKIKHKPPVYSIRRRTCKLLQLPGMTMDAVPGPGTYVVPSTTYFDHPAIKMPRRTKFPKAPRFPDKFYG